MYIYPISQPVLTHSDNRTSLQSMQIQDKGLVLSSDAKPRLKWTPELHQRFVDAISHLGGADKATPKSLMRVMGIHGLTLYHLKSHLQKYRLGKSQPSQTCIDNDREEYEENQKSQLNRDGSDKSQNQINESLQITQSLQMQMEVQRKLHDQIEVRRHLQLRIEAQGKYLRSVSQKAQDTLSGYNSTSAEVEFAKAEVSHLVSVVDNGFTSSSLSVLSEIRGSSLKDFENKLLRNTRYSLESSLTSSESSGRKEACQGKYDINDRTNMSNSNAVALSLMEMCPENKSASTEQVNGRKRSGSTISDGNCVGQPSGKRSTAQKSAGHLRKFDLNRHCSNDFDSDPEAIDLNRKEVEQLNLLI